MKKLLVIIVSFPFCFYSFATIRAVSNSDSAAQYRTIQAAINASKAGDSVYVNGSPYYLFRGKVVKQYLGV